MKSYIGYISDVIQVTWLASNHGKARVNSGTAIVCMDSDQRQYIHLSWVLYGGVYMSRMQIGMSRVNTMGYIKLISNYIDLGVHTAYGTKH